MHEMAALMQKRTDQELRGQNKKTENVGSLAHAIRWPISGNRPVALKTTGDLVDSPRLSGILIYAAQTISNQFEEFYFEI